jgi:hypothetical protein
MAPEQSEFAATLPQLMGVLKVYDFTPDVRLTGDYETFTPLEAALHGAGVARDIDLGGLLVGELDLHRRIPAGLPQMDSCDELRDRTTSAWIRKERRASSFLRQ